VLVEKTGAATICEAVGDESEKRGPSEKAQFFLWLSTEEQKHYKEAEVSASPSGRGGGNLHGAVFKLKASLVERPKKKKGRGKQGAMPSSKIHRT